MTAVAAAFELERFTWSDGTFEVVGRWSHGPPAGRVRLAIEVDGRRRRIAAKRVGDGEEWRATFACARRPEHAGEGELEIGSALVIELPRPELPEVQAAEPAVRGAEAVLERLRSERAESEAATRRLAEEREAAEEATRRLAEERAKGERAVREAAEKAAADAGRAATERAAKDAGKAADKAAERAVKDVAQAARQAAEQAAREVAERSAADMAKTRRRGQAEAEREEGDDPPAAGRQDPDRRRPAPRPFTPATPRRRAELHRALERPREPRTTLPVDKPDERRAVAYVVAFLIVIVIGVLLVLLV